MGSSSVAIPPQQPPPPAAASKKSQARSQVSELTSMCTDQGSSTSIDSLNFFSLKYNIQDFVFHHLEWMDICSFVYLFEINDFSLGIFITGEMSSNNAVPEYYKTSAGGSKQITQKHNYLAPRTQAKAKGKSL